MVRPRRAHPRPGDAVRQGQADRVAQVAGGKLHPIAQRRQRAGGFQDRQIPPMSRDPEGVVHFRHHVHKVLAEVHPPQARACVAHHGPQLFVLAVPLRTEPRVLPLEQQNTLHDRLPQPDVPLPGDLDAQPEPVQQLRPKLPLLRVHRPHQQEPRRVPVAHSLPHHHVHARHRHVQKDVHHVIVQEVHFVDVQHVPVRLPQYPHLELPAPLPKRRLQVQAPDHPVLRRVQREVHHLHPPGLVPQNLSRRLTGTALVARQRPADAPETAPRHHFLRGKDRRERTHRRRLPRTLLPAQQHTTDRRVHRVHQQALLQKLLPHQRAEGKRVHWISIPWSGASTPGSGCTTGSGSESDGRGCRVVLHYARKNSSPGGSDCIRPIMWDRIPLGGIAGPEVAGFPHRIVNSPCTRRTRRSDSP